MEYVAALPNGRRNFCNGLHNKLYADYMEYSNYVNSVIVEYVEGIEVIKAFNQSSSSYEKFAKAVAFLCNSPFLSNAYFTGS